MYPHGSNLNGVTVIVQTAYRLVRVGVVAIVVIVQASERMKQN